MPDEYLASLSVADRSSMWRQALSQPLRSRSFRFVAVEPSGTVVGFAAGGPEAGEDGSQTGELYAINVDPDAWGTGAGSALLQSALTALKNAGFEEAILWVHPDNARARRFYEGRDWQADDLTRVQDVLGVQVAETRYSQKLI